MGCCQGISMPIGSENTKCVKETEPTTREKILQLWRDGYSTTQIAEILSMTNRNVRKHFLSLGITKKERNNNMYSNEITILIQMLKKNPLLNIKNTVSLISKEEQNTGSMIRYLYWSKEYKKIEVVRKELLKWKKTFMQLIKSLEEDEDIEEIEEKIQQILVQIPAIPMEKRVPIEAGIMKRAGLSTRLSDLYWDQKYVHILHHIRLLEDKKHAVRLRRIKTHLDTLDQELQSMALNLIVNKYYGRQYEKVLLEEYIHKAMPNRKSL